MHPFLISHFAFDFPEEIQLHESELQNYMLIVQFEYAPLAYLPNIIPVLLFNIPMNSMVMLK